MKIKQLIRILSSQDPEGTVSGVENLRLEVAVIPGTGLPTVAKKKVFLKGLARQACALAPGDAQEVAARFNVSTHTVHSLRREVLLEQQSKQGQLVFGTQTKG